MESLCKCPKCGSCSLMSGKYVDYCEECKYRYVHSDDEEPNDLDDLNNEE